MQTPQQNALDICTRLSSVPRRLLVPCASRVGSPKISISYPSANNIRIHRARARIQHDIYTTMKFVVDDERIIGDARFLFQTKRRLDIFNSFFSDPTRLYYRLVATFIMVFCAFCGVSMFQLFISDYFVSVATITVTV